MWIMLMSCCLLPFLLLCPHLCATSFPQVDDEDPSYSMIFASLNAQTYNIFAWLYNRSLTIFSPDYSKLHLKPNTCHLLHHLFILLVGFVCFKHPPNQPKLPSQNMQTKILLRNYIIGTKIPTPKIHGNGSIHTCFFLDKKYQPQKFPTLQLPGWSVALLAPVKAPCWKRWRGQDQHSLGTALVGEVGWQEGGKPRRQRMEVVIDDCWEFLAGPSSFVWNMMKKAIWRWKFFLFTPVSCVYMLLVTIFWPSGRWWKLLLRLIFYWEGFEH